MAKCARCGDTGYCKSCGGQKPCHCGKGREKAREQQAQRMKTAKANQRAMAKPRNVNRRTGPMVQSFVRRGLGK